MFIVQKTVHSDMLINYAARVISYDRNHDYSTDHCSVSDAEKKFIQLTQELTPHTLLVLAR